MERRAFFIFHSRISTSHKNHSEKGKHVTEEEICKRRDINAYQTSLSLSKLSDGRMVPSVRISSHHFPGRMNPMPLEVWRLMSRTKSLFPNKWCCRRKQRKDNRLSDNPRPHVAPAPPNHRWWMPVYAWTKTSMTLKAIASRDREMRSQLVRGSVCERIALCAFRGPHSSPNRSHACWIAG